MSMDREDIIRMAAYSGMELYGLGKDREKFIYHLTSFATLAASAERDECAKLLEETADCAKAVDPEGFVWRATEGSAELIRARGRV